MTKRTGLPTEVLNENWRERRINNAAATFFFMIFLLSILILHTTFVFASQDLYADNGEAQSLSTAKGVRDMLNSQPAADVYAIPRDTPRGRITRRILALPFRDDVVYEVLVGYGVTLELKMPDEVRDVVVGDERLVVADYLKEKVYLKGVAYAIGESTTIHINTISENTLHLWVRVVEPSQSDYAFRFTTPSREVFSKSHIEHELKKERKSLEAEVAEREDNLEKTVEKLSEEKLKLKILKEEKTVSKKKAVGGELELTDVVVTRLLSKVYIKFRLKNKSEHDFPVSAILLGQGILDPNDPDKIIGFEDIEIEPPTLESTVVRSGQEIRALLVFDFEKEGNADKYVLKVIETGNFGRVAEFKNLNFSR